VGSGETYKIVRNYKQILEYTGRPVGHVHTIPGLSVGANLGPTHECARSRSERRHKCSADAQGGQTGQGDRSDRFAGEE
jgi:hypothetical protein